ncbi:MAG: nucleotidyltransferase domain-containing protein [Caldilineaceae bacterium]|nr:nucleotidyltransferase domain-containing protein [Caldilineaceae bacterium]
MTSETIAQLIQIAQSHHINFLGLFGSAARDELTAQSDIDLAVRFAQPVTLLEMVDIQLAMTAVLQRAVDLVPIDDMYPFMRDSIKNDLVVLFDAQDHSQPVELARHVYA